MDRERTRDDANNCFVCGPHNPIGLQLNFRIENDVCLAQFTPGENHMGYDNLTHGGIIYSVLDDVMANWLFLQGKRAVTAKCEVRYRQPVTFGTTLRLEGKLIRKKGKLYILSGAAICSRSGDPLVESTGTFLTTDERVI